MSLPRARSAISAPTERKSAFTAVETKRTKKKGRGGTGFPYPSFLSRRRPPTPPARNATPDAGNRRTTLTFLTFVHNLRTGKSLFLSAKTGIEKTTRHVRTTTCLVVFRRWREKSAGNGLKSTKKGGCRHLSRFRTAKIIHLRAKSK